MVTFLQSNQVIMRAQLQPHGMNIEPSYPPSAQAEKAESKNMVTFLKTNQDKV